MAAIQLTIILLYTYARLYIHRMIDLHDTLSKYTNTVHFPEVYLGKISDVPFLSSRYLDKNSLWKSLFFVTSGYWTSTRR